MKHRILFLQGVNDQRKVGVIINKVGELQLLFDGGCNVFEFLRHNDDWNVEVALLVPGDWRQTIELKKSALIVNELSDPDSHSKALTKAIKVREFFSEVPCINEPAAVQQNSREKVSEKLASIPGVFAPKTIRTNLNRSHEVATIWEAQFDGPIIVKKAGTHGGTVTALLRTRDDMGKLDAIALDGGPFYISEFNDFKSADGLYRKYRIVVVNGQPFLRHVIASDNWLIHSSSRSYMNQISRLQDEETSQLDNFSDDLKPRIELRCQQIAERIGLDYFGIDGGFLDDGRLIVFEANANMNVLINNQPKPNVWESQIQFVIDALTELISSKIPS